MEKFIDYNHYRETIVYVVLDKEGRAESIRNKLINTQSKFNSNRTITKANYIHLWDKKTIEFENFTSKEIALSLTEICYGDYSFSDVEIKKCYEKSQTKDGNHLNDLFEEKTGYGLPKTELLRVLCNHIVANAENEFDKDGLPIRSITKMLLQIISLASRNHPSARLDISKNNQGSGFFGDITE